MTQSETASKIVGLPLTGEQVRAIEELLLKKFRSAQKMTANGDGTPVWKNLFFMLDLISRGDFYGTIQFKVVGCVVKDVRVVDRTFKVDEMYRDVLAPPGKTL